MNAKGYQEIEPVNSQIENQYTDHQFSFNDNEEFFC